MAKPKISPAIIETACEALEDGATHKLAAAMCGIGESTYHAWQAAGRKQNGDIYQDFLEQTEQAIAVHAMRSLELITKSDQSKDHKWLLARRHGFTESSHSHVTDDEPAPDGLDHIEYMEYLLRLTVKQRKGAIKDGSHVAAERLIKLELSLSEQLTLARNTREDDPASLTKEEWQDEVERKAQALKLPDLEVMVKEYMSRTGATLEAPKGDEE